MAAKKKSTRKLGKSKKLASKKMGAVQTLSGTGGAGSGKIRF